MRVIRPLVYVREKSLRQFSSLNNLPILINTNGPEPTKERQRAKQLLAQQEILFPKLFNSLRASVIPLLGFQEVSPDIKSKETFKCDNADAETEKETPLNTD